jgi:uncharacterized protein (DUF1501 family)
LFNTGKVAILANVGTLVAPITRAQYFAGSVAVPPQLFSHNDQQVEWQTSIPDQPSKTGWGGRCADLLYTLNAGAQVSMSISLSGFNTFEVGDLVQQYQVSTTGSVGLTNLSTNQLNAVKNIIALPQSNLYAKAYSQIVDRAIQNDALLTAALNSQPALTTVFPNTTLGNQLKMIARLISVRSALSMKRQIFFCSVGGYDTHSGQVGDAAHPNDPLYGAHANLLAELSQSLKAFYDATVEIGIPDKITAFTASDFGRTFPSNGVGSDHGWGAHQVIVGGAVRGQSLYGAFPALAVNGPDDTGLGRWIPTTSVDEYSATLARWFGVGNSDLNTVFPNLNRFVHPDLGFML